VSPTAEELVPPPAWRAQIADPKPQFCAGCLAGADADTVFVDLGVPIDRGVVRTRESNAVLAELSRLSLCEGCVREMAECLGFVPVLHRRHLAKLREVMAERDELAKQNVMLKALVGAGVPQ
jgi:hypothetical protein